MKHYTYFFILILSLAGPLLLSFDKKVQFYRKWKYVFPAMILPAIIYIAWDSWFTGLGIWSFNREYISGIYIFNLPVEEVLFFFVVPYCCLFIYECILSYFPSLQCIAVSDYVLGAIGFVLLVMGFIFRQKMYTVSTSLFTSLFIAFLLSFRNLFQEFNSRTFLVSYAVILFPFLIVNGFLTALPVVLYNNSENLNVRIYTIPAEDIFYGMLLVLMNVVIYEKLKKTGNKNKGHLTSNISSHLVL
ncbi:MAG: lycopene cyclase domain-containing protein [Ferruginibacter sp.]